MNVERRTPRRRRRRLWPRVVLGALVVAAAFAAGLAVGAALDESPRPGGTVTVIRTVEPLPAVTTTP